MSVAPARTRALTYEIEASTVLEVTGLDCSGAVKDRFVKWAWHTPLG